MAYEFPDEDTLAKYLCMLREVLLAARYAEQPLVEQLMDAVENVPDLLARWPHMDEALVFGQLEDIERKYPDLAGRFTTILREGPPPSWQLKWNRTP
jgi:hypothetical protein